MSFFGFGRNRNHEDDEIPLSSSQHSQEDGSGIQSAPPAPVISPTGPPPTHVDFVPSPALSSPTTTNTTPTIRPEAATAELEIPNIHVFNPGHHEQPQQSEDPQQQFAQEEEGYYEGGEDTVNLKPSIDSYGTAGEGTYEDDFESGGGYDQQDPSQQHQQQQSYYYEDEIQEFSTAYTHHPSGSMEEMSQEEPQPVSSSQETDTDTPQQQQYGGGGYDTEQSSAPQPMLSSQEEEDYQYKYNSSAYYGQDEPIPEPVETPYQFQYQYQPQSEQQQQQQPQQPSTPSHVRRSILHSLRSPDKRPAEHRETPQEKQPKTAADAIFTPEFKQLHQKNSRRRLNAQRHRQELERRLAKITNRLANLSMDREAQQSGFIRDHVCAPMEKAVERIANERTYLSLSPMMHTGDDNKHWMGLSTRLSRLETDMTQYVHVTMQDTMREHIDRVHDELIHEDIPQHHVDTYRSEKREASLLREYESHAGRCQRRYHEERGVRFGALEVVRQQLLTADKLENDPARIEEAISKVKALRAKLDEERAERKMQDENLLRAIHEEEINMKRALFQATEVGTSTSTGTYDDTVRRAIEY